MLELVSELNRWVNIAENFKLLGNTVKTLNESEVKRLVKNSISTVRKMGPDIETAGKSEERVPIIKRLKKYHFIVLKT
ncbi:MAG: hypothetical protein RL613_1154 [Fusobacteriota bacterium]